MASSLLTRFEEKALERVLREDLHTCIPLCNPERGFHAYYATYDPICPATAYRVTWRDRIMVVLDWMGEISL